MALPASRTAARSAAPSVRWQPEHRKSAARAAAAVNTALSPGSSLRSLRPRSLAGERRSQSADTSPASLGPSDRRRPQGAGGDMVTAAVGRPLEVGVEVGDDVEQVRFVKVVRFLEA